MSVIEFIFYFVVFAIAGVSFEVLMTSITNAIRYKNTLFRGKTTAWMFPIYGAVSFIIIGIHALFPNISIFIRAIFYTVLILAWEYISGAVIKQLVGHAPWDYRGAYPDYQLNPKKHIHGLICLEFVPLWYVMSIFSELLYVFLSAHVVL